MGEDIITAGVTGAGTQKDINAQGLEQGLEKASGDSSAQIPTETHKIRFRATEYIPKRNFRLKLISASQRL